MDFDDPLLDGGMKEARDLAVFGNRLPLDAPENLSVDVARLAQLLGEAGAPVGETQDGGTPPLPCPFCGGEGLPASAEFDRNNPLNGELSHFIVCRSCAAEGPWFKSPGLALKMWNTRAALGRSVPAEPTPEPWKALRHVADEIEGQLQAGVLRDQPLERRIYWAQVAAVAREALRGAPPQGEPPTP